MPKKLVSSPSGFTILAPAIGVGMWALQQGGVKMPAWVVLGAYGLAAILFVVGLWFLIGDIRHFFAGTSIETGPTVGRDQITPHQEAYTHSGPLTQAGRDIIYYGQPESPPKALLTFRRKIPFDDGYLHEWDLRVESKYVVRALRISASSPTIRSLNAVPTFPQGGDLHIPIHEKMEGARLIEIAQASGKYDVQVITDKDEAVIIDAVIL